MDSADLIVIGMCVAIILIGVAVLSLRRDRAVGIIGTVLGTVALVAWLAAEDQPSEQAMTPALLESATPDTPASPVAGP